MKKLCVAICGLVVMSVPSLSAQIPLSQIEGFLEVHLPKDTTSMYIGLKAGQHIDTSSRMYNVFLGSEAGKHNTSGNDNVLIGRQAGYMNISGSDNVFIGEGTGFSNVSGRNNVFIGEEAGDHNVSGDGNVFVGREAGEDSKGNFNTYIGFQSGEDVDSTNSNTAVGHEAGGYFSGDFNTFLGAQAGGDADNGESNIGLGYEAGYDNDGSFNCFLGNSAGYDNVANNNVFVGYESGRNNRAGHSNSFLGYRSGMNNDDGNSNSFFGNEAGHANDDGNFNTFFGNEAGMKSVSGSRNVFVGSTSGKENIDGQNQTFIGHGAGVSSIHGQNSVVIGNGAAFNDTAILSSVYIGHLAGQLSPGLETNRTGNVFIGNFAGFDQTGSNRLFVSNSSVGKEEALIYGEFDGGGLLRVNGDLQIAANAASGNSRLLMKGVGGNLNEVIRYDGDENDVVMGSVTGAGGKLFLRADGSTRMAIIENGNVGIGNNNPVYKLEVAGTGHFDDDITTGGNVTGDNIVGANVSTGTLYLNNVPIGSSTTDLRLDGSGQVIRSSSDIRLKKNISTIPDALSKVLQLRGVQYLWKQDEAAGRQLGVIAQEVKEVVPEIVNEFNGLYGVDYSETAGLFIEAFKEQQQMIDGQQEEIAMLKHLLDKAINEIQDIKSTLSQDQHTTED